MQKTYLNKWSCHFESHEPIVREKAIASFKELYLWEGKTLDKGPLVFRFVNLKKRKKRLITIIPGPHVHNKSREQFVIDRYNAILTVFEKGGETKPSALKKPCAANIFSSKDARADLISLDTLGEEANSITSSGVSCVHSWKEKLDLGGV